MSTALAPAAPKADEFWSVLHGFDEETPCETLPPFHGKYGVGVVVAKIVLDKPCNHNSVLLVCQGCLDRLRSRVGEVKCPCGMWYMPGECLVSVVPV